jgi:opacity protein-like surface antigen
MDADGGLMVRKKGWIFSFAGGLLTTTAVMASTAPSGWQSLEGRGDINGGYTFNLPGNLQRGIQTAALEIAQVPEEYKRPFLTLRNLPSGAELQLQPFQIILPGFKFPPLEEEKSRLEKFADPTELTKNGAPAADKPTKTVEPDESVTPPEPALVGQVTPQLPEKSTWKPKVSLAEKIGGKSKSVVMATPKMVPDKQTSQAPVDFPPPPLSAPRPNFSNDGEGSYLAVRVVGIDEAPSVQAVDGADLNVSPEKGFAVTAAIGYGWGGFRTEGEVMYAQADLDQISVNAPGDISGLTSGTFSAQGSQTYAGMLLNGAYDFQNDSGFVPFVMVGGGAVYQSLKDARAGSVSIPNVRDWAMAYQAGTGVNIGLTRNLSAEVSYRYLGVTDGDHFRADATHTLAVGAKALF